MSNLPRKALSVRQPWAWAIMFAGKDVENRSWQAMNRGLNVRGRVMIHASSGMTRREYDHAADFMRGINVDCPTARDLYRGAVIGSVEIVDAVKNHPSPWFFGPRALVLRDPIPCRPIPVKGNLGFFDWQNFKTSEFPKLAKWMLPTKIKAQSQGTLL